MKPYKSLVELDAIEIKDENGVVIHTIKIEKGWTYSPVYTKIKEEGIER